MANNGQIILDGESFDAFIAAIESFENKVTKLCNSFDKLIGNCRESMKDDTSKAIIKKVELIPTNIMAIIKPTVALKEKLLYPENTNDNSI